MIVLIASPSFPTVQCEDDDAAADDDDDDDDDDEGLGFRAEGILTMRMSTVIMK